MRWIQVIMVFAVVWSGCSKLYLYKSKGKLYVLGDKSEVRKGKKFLDLGMSYSKLSRYVKGVPAAEAAANRAYKYGLAATILMGITNVATVGAVSYQIAGVVMDPCSRKWELMLAFVISRAVLMIPELLLRQHSLTNMMDAIHH